MGKRGGTRAGPGAQAKGTMVATGRGPPAGRSWQLASLLQIHFQSSSSSSAAPEKQEVGYPEYPLYGGEDDRGICLRPPSRLLSELGIKTAPLLISG